MASTDKIHFDLDAVERGEDFEVFAFPVTNQETKERRILHATDPADIDYQDLLAIETPVQFFRYTMSQEDRDFLATTRIKGWRLGKLVEAYLEHYKAQDRVGTAEQRKKLGF